MKEELKKLKEKFEIIKKMGWVPQKGQGFRSCGYTFETLLEKETDTFPLHDYSRIEIKVMNDNTKTNLHLFNLTPDGDYLFPIKRILDELGCPCKENHEEKKLYKTFSAKDYTKMVFGRKVIIKVNYEKSKVELIAYNYQNENMNIGISWSFDYLKERLFLKLNYLAFVRVSSCFMYDGGYYRYHDITFYKLKDFDTFIKLIAMGIIEITFKIGTHKDGNKAGMLYDHGTDFSIKVENLEMLYEKIIV